MQSVPIALSIPFRTGIVNLGGEGQMVIGGFAAAITAINMPGPGIVRIMVAGKLVGSSDSISGAAPCTQPVAR